MRTHRVDSYLLTENIRLEIVHESNPYFAGENISLVIRIKHLGSYQELVSLKDSLKELHEEIEAQGAYVESQDNDNTNVQEDGRQPWSMKSLLNAMKGMSEEDVKPNNAHIDLERQKRQREQLVKQIKYHKPVELMSGYVQIFGMFQFDPEVINETKLDKTSVKVVGLDTPLSHVTKKMSGTAVEENDSNQPNSLAKYFHSKRSAQFLGSSNVNEDELKGDHNAVFTLAAHDESVEYRQFPILLIPQTLLFSELNLEPGETKVFRFKSSKLSRMIPPSYYVSPNISINYSLEVGMGRLYHGDIEQDTIKVPINIAPFVSRSGAQYSPVLNEKVTIMEPGLVKEVKQRQPSGGRVVSSTVHQHARRPSAFSLMNSDRNQDVEKLIHNFAKLVESNQDEFGDLEELVDSQMAIQFPEESSDESPTLMNSDEKREDENGYVTKRMSTVSSNVSDLARLTANRPARKLGFNEEKGLIPQLDNLQNIYQINWNGQSITRIVCSKRFYTITDDIDLVLELDHNSPPTHKVSAVTVTLESCELINPEYVTDLENLKKPQVNRIYDAHAICFDDCDRIPLKLIMPKTPMYQLASQFKTDVFQLRWMLGIKFVLVPRTANISLEQFYEDKKGVLYHAKEILEGEEFSCHIPLAILPSASKYGGW
ncbi:ZYRO0D06116p [Zygosaccharomyces rouxii]|uniref:ZYRO0D06116p n=1 Tax=Zygosaccharomyces rouxii (strain ATCC 2623 / CBS 732 / NBRC 1130 / NCYC 568 / NRRL Y-229) TaxID=559307 RepID=C5DVE9_ZYGRC|nr:uncharacterized protein ZYRO0D06116g [Zygosaccharomyces rouxii]KAH9200681.1 Rgp1-domain-containing protein [Zygosaccharomyces rouxii]CAR27768.1 ZYRO0D06116p [Zygosaccharomyces rouxii]